MALEQVSSVVKSTYLNNVAGYDIQYNVAQDEGQNVTSITGTVKKADIRFGYITINADGTKKIFRSTDLYRMKTAKPSIPLHYPIQNQFLNNGILKNNDYHKYLTKVYPGYSLVLWI